MCGLLVGCMRWTRLLLMDMHKLPAISLLYDTTAVNMKERAGQNLHKAEPIGLLSRPR